MNSEFDRFVRLQEEAMSRFFGPSFDSLGEPSRPFNAACPACKEKTTDWAIPCVKDARGEDYLRMLLPCGHIFDKDALMKGGVRHGRGQE